MAYMEHSVKRIAIKQLITALRLYFEVTDRDVEGYYAVITLAGASEEILGELLNELGVENALDGLKKDFSIFNRAFSNEDLPDKAYGRPNFIRNSLKHWSPGRDPKVSVFDVENEARELLNRALKNHTKLIDNSPLDKELSDVELSELEGRFQHESYGVGGYS